MLKQEQQDLLENSILGKYLTREELENLLSHSKIINFAPGEIILQQGKESPGIFTIIDGTVLVTAKLLGEGFTQLETLEPGKFMGEVSFIAGIPNPTSKIANTHVRCLLITKTYFEFLAAYSPQTKYKIFTAISKQVSERLKKLHDKITQFISTSDMSTKSLFGDIIQSLTKPTEIKIEEAGITSMRLEQLLLFSHFTKDDVDELLNHAVLIKAPKNCTIIRKDEKNASCYIVIQGAVQSSIMHANKVAKLSVIGPETLFAGIACVDRNSNFNITFVTCELAVLLRISEEDLEFLQNNKPKLWYKIFDLICKSLVALEKSVDKLDIRLNIETYNR